MTIPAHIAGLPAPPPEALAASQSLARMIAGEIAANGGGIAFARYMELALYAPGLGYYMAGARKLGRDGDFVTAPEISPFFGRTLARCLAPLLAGGLEEVLEIGAGSGALAADLLLELERLGRLPHRYLILELSAELRGRSRDTLAARAPRLLDRVAWLNALPPAFTGIVIGNEVLDAMPVDRVVRRGGGTLEAHVGCREADGSFLDIERPAGDALRAAAAALALPDDDYQTEIQLVARGFIRTLGGMLVRGAALFFDYGFPRAEYYHPQRNRGTLMCHYRHRAHGDPYFLPGLQDITSHIDFSAIAQAGREGGLDLLGYTSQAQFLVNCGITDLLAQSPPGNVSDYAPRAAQVQTLTSPAEMGELVKVIALGRGCASPIRGFERGDRSAALGALLMPVVLAAGLAIAAAAPGPTAAAAPDKPSVSRARYLWSQSPHGRMLERILPPAIEPGELPEPKSDGARLTARYCVQCHYLPSPQMHTADKWKTSVERMVWRMRGRGNLGELMKQMMESVEAPADSEVAVLTAYLQRHGQKEMDPAHPALKSEDGQRYSIACSQCHELPDPQRHAPRDWPRVVDRMKRHMAWTNTVVGPETLKTNPVLDTAAIVRFLQRHARGR